MSDSAHKQTIYAFSTAAGRAAIAVLRVSGPGAGEAIRHLTGGAPPKPRMAALRRIFHRGERIDDALVLWFPGPKSETGEDMAEFHLHGGRAIATAALEALAELSALRPAGPGEFTRQAFENGRLDLTQAEAIADLVEAETTAQRRQALRQMDGELAGLYEGWRERLLASLAHLEALIDFPEEDLPDRIRDELGRDIKWLQKDIIQNLAQNRGERVREGFAIAILGAPNAGKSSLLNLLARREAAIVSTRAGTTRDIVEVHLAMAGYPIILADTAGLRPTSDEIEAEGVRRAIARAKSADLNLVLFDGTRWPALDPQSEALVNEGSMALLSKADLAPDLPSEPRVAGRPALAISIRTGVGIEPLLRAIEALVVERLGPGETPALTRQRHREALEECADALGRAAAATASELLAEDLRLAARALGRITGRVDVEDILDRIFRDFCIGK